MNYLMAVRVCFIDFQEIGALFLRKMYPVWDLPDFSTDLKPASAYPIISEAPSLV
jgi:hypothetical protein